jgi:hypothetical protein
MMDEPIKIAAVVTLIAIVIIAVFTVLIAALYFHSKKRPFPAQTVILLKWLIRVLVYLFLAAKFGGSDLRFVTALLK